MPPNPTTNNPRRQPWYAQGLRFECTQCGNCCTGPQGVVWFTKTEAAAIAQLLDLTVEQFHQHYTHTVYGRRSISEHRTKHGYDCVFLQRDDDGHAMCSIYPVRPSQCRTWPFWTENIKSPAAWRRAGQRCPGMNAGRLYTPDQIRIIRDTNT